MSPILDPSALERLRRIGGDRLVRAMVTSFIENGAARIDAARTAANAGDAAGVSDAAHALKSSAGNLGATTLQLTAQKVERESLEGGASIGALVEELGAAFDEARVAAERAHDAAGPS
jgi:HPt (histidine-containing phosphotransfer) domain-containing protein